jgi:hypothetical protein
MLQNLLDCGLIKEWYFNGKFNVVLKADDPHLQIKELKRKLDRAIAERDGNQVCIDALKQKLQDHCIHCHVKEQEDDLVEDLQDTNKVLAHNGVRLNKMLDEKDWEIAMLKKRICNGDVSRLTWIDDCIAKDKEIAKLKEERRWRKCGDEMPQKYDDGDCFLIAVEHESTTNPKGYYVTIAELVDGSWSDDEGEEIDEYIEYDLENSIFRSQAPKGTKKGFYRSKVTHWMPLPKAPEEADK